MKLVLFGGGGHARVVADVARAAGFELLGVLTPNESPLDPEFTRLGDDGWLNEAPPDVGFHIAFAARAGQTDREQLFARLVSDRALLPALISPAAQVSRFARIGSGSLIVHCAIVNAGAEIGAGAIVNSGAIVEHGCLLGDHSHVAPGAIVTGEARIGRGCVVGAGAIVLPGISVADRTVIGAGAVVVRSITERGGIWSGNPARRHQ